MKSFLLTGAMCLLLLVAGCYSIDSGQSQLTPVVVEPTASAVQVDGREVDLVERLSAERLSYRGSLETLMAYYSQTGDNMKFNWVRDELAKFDGLPQYRYIIEAGVAGADLKARYQIPEADEMYAVAYKMESNARFFFLVVDGDGLRLALEKYNALIREYPTSDKIDDAAYRAALIYQHFKDYTIALLYFERTYQWDNATVHPARFKAAYILDTVMSRRAEALDLYKQAIKDTSVNENYKEFAKMRIEEITAEEDVVSNK